MKTIVIYCGSGSEFHIYLHLLAITICTLFKQGELGLNKIISSAIAVSAITVSTVFGLSLVNVNSSKANPQSNRISQRNSTEKRVNKGKTQFLQGRGELKHVCKSKVEGGTCEYSETVTYTNEYSLNGTVDLKFLQTESGFKIGRQFSKTVRVNQKIRF
ncbi:hypothetical protein PN455_15310 [Dolichospermum circinale CS-539]|uniref:hypothetical protein n=1 Tax=Dolichospermum circinale TaxID=109265 RepID=UPI00232A8267|nr:hypothetical protein [Dolichospermum circinale]MDB9466545.1 hypothetical protein [Dolichospermum circinale CS-539/09]MDB9471961.1 hypothetical protein [Dolichospermum circinale CS-539]